MKCAAVVLGFFLCACGGAASAQAQETSGASGPITDLSAIASADPSGAKRFLADPGELVTLYGSRRFDPYYEPGRQPPPTDPATGWPIDWSLGSLAFVGGYYSPYRYGFNPYGYGYYHSYYRPRYLPYRYGYGWGYQYPFGYNPWRSYGYYGSLYPNYGYPWRPPYVDYGAPFYNGGVIVSPPMEFGGCFFW
jgi:hypothetical protein